MDREQLAKKMGITAGYLGHVERDWLVHISPAMVKNIKTILGVNVYPMVDQHNFHVARLLRQAKGRLAD